MPAKIKTILICSNHPEQPVPLIFTMAFRGAEHWCPFCGFTGGMFISGKEVELTVNLKKLKIMWEAKSKEYLNALSSLRCSSLMYKGKRITPSELPEKELERLRKIVKEWKYNEEL